MHSSVPVGLRGEEGVEGSPRSPFPRSPCPCRARPGFIRRPHVTLSVIGAPHLLDWAPRACRRSALLNGTLFGPAGRLPARTRRLVAAEEQLFPHLQLGVGRAPHQGRERGRQVRVGARKQPAHHRARARCTHQGIGAGTLPIRGWGVCRRLQLRRRPARVPGRGGARASRCLPLGPRQSPSPHPLTRPCPPSLLRSRPGDSKFGYLADKDIWDEAW